MQSCSHEARRPDTRTVGTSRFLDWHTPLRLLNANYGLQSLPTRVSNLRLIRDGSAIPMDPDRSPASRHPQRTARAHLQFPSTSWALLADASRRTAHAATALNEFTERYYAAVRAFIGAV